MITKIKRAPTDTGACGTPRGYDRHRRRGEVACVPCTREASTARRGRDETHRPRVGPAPIPVPKRLGWLAGTTLPHKFRPLSVTQCGWCFGWSDDPRHP